MNKFLQIFGETLQNKLLFLPKKSLYNLPNLFLIKKIEWLKFMFTSHVRSKFIFC